MPVLLIIALAVVGISIISVLAASQLEDARVAFLVPLDRYALVVAARDVIDPHLVERIRRHPAVAEVIPVVQGNVRVPTLLGSQARWVLGLSERDLPRYLAVAGLRVAEGRLPRPGRDEIAVHRQIASARGWRIGQRIGQQVDESEWLRGRYTLVGLLEGDLQVGVAPIEAMRRYSPLRHVEGDYALVAVPAPGRYDELDRYLRGLPRSQVQVHTRSTAQERFEQETASVDVVIWTIDLVTVTVLSLAVGLLNTIYFLQRMGEYGTLAALGYRLGFLVRRTLAEALTLTLLGWLLGLGLAQGLALALHRFVFGPRGITLADLDAQAVTFTVPVPVLTAIFSLATVLRHLRRLDPVAIVERRD